VLGVCVCVCLGGLHTSLCLKHCRSIHLLHYSLEGGEHECVLSVQAVLAQSKDQSFAEKLSNKLKAVCPEFAARVGALAF
jgi:hypothetical protein